MGFFDRFRKKATVSSGSQAPAGKTPSPQRAPRVQILPLHRISFLPVGDRFTGPLHVANISRSGIAFLKSAGHEWPSPGERIRGTVQIGMTSNAVECRVIHAMGRIVGCEYEGETGKLAVALGQYFDVELKALKM